MSSQRLSESEIIALFARTAPVQSELLVSNGDDAAAFVTAPGESVVVTTDTLVERVHFDFAFSPPGSVGEKLMAVNLSDLAAMGAKPRYALLSLCIPDTCGRETLSAIADGVHRAADRLDVAIIGGNVTKSPDALVLSATLFGATMPEALISRGSSQVGDALFVTGALGGARAALAVLLAGGEPLPELAERLHRPIPRVEAGLRLAATQQVSAMSDISDGLGKDLRRLLGPAGLGARLDADRVPLAPGLVASEDQLGETALECALKGGEDYELLFTARPEAEPALEGALRSTGVPLTRIGEVIPEPRFERLDGTPLPHGFDHFPGG